MGQTEVEAPHPRAADAPLRPPTDAALVLGQTGRVPSFDARRGVAVLDAVTNTPEELTAVITGRGPAEVTVARAPSEEGA